MSIVKKDDLKSIASDETLKKMQSPTFCVYPWMEQVIEPTSKMCFCSIATGGGVIRKPDGAPFLAGQDQLKEAWNSDFMRDIRGSMLEGKKVPQCSTCYFQESIQKISYRQMHNYDWLNQSQIEIQNRVQYSVENNYKLNQPAFYLDLRLGTLCNLKCRSCGPSSSIQIQKEALHLIDTDPEYKKFWIKHNGDNRPDHKSGWEEDAGFWAEVTEAVPNLKKVYLTGGEPTLIEKNYDFLRMCVESGHSQHIQLMFNTNCTNIRDEFLELLTHFESVLITLSIDGFGKINEYIRFMSRWEIIDKNFRKVMLSKGNIKIGVATVMQTYSIFDVTLLLDYIEGLVEEYQRPVEVDLLYAKNPNYIDIIYLPQSIKLAAAKKIEDFKLRSRLYKNPQSLFSNTIDSFLNLLYDDSSDTFSKERVQDFIKYTEMLDRHRKQNWKETFPELYDHLKQHNLTHC